MIRLVVSIAAFSILQGCATMYQSGAGTLTGGYFHTQVTDKIEKIEFRANGYTDAGDAQNYAMFRSAEYANENNKPYFIMYASLRDVALNRPTMIPSVGSIGNKPTTFSYVRLTIIKEFGATETAIVLKRLDKLKKKMNIVSAGDDNES